MSDALKYRYPGPQPFGVEDQAIFYGREQEINALYNLLMVERHTVLFAQSGIGKTSLLKAGILPKLVGSPYAAVDIRLNDTEKDPLEQVLAQFPEKADTLWEALQAYYATTGKIPLLIFDQFEELFTLYAPEKRQALIHNLADVINQRLPKQVEAKIREQIDELSSQAILDLEQVPYCRMVFAIRSDRLSYLHQLGNQIPAILRNRFELQPLKPQFAQDAIEKPAQINEGNYTCPRFAYAPEAIALILDKLSKRHQEQREINDTIGEGENKTVQYSKGVIEAFQLQLVCRHIEGKLIEKQKNGEWNEAQAITIDAPFFGRAKGIDLIIEQFYANTLDKIGEDKQRQAASDLIETQFIKAENRISIAHAAIFADYPDLTKETLMVLVNERLLRREDRQNRGAYYEISHDTLIKPILKRQRERLKEQREQERLATKKKAEEERQRREKAERLQAKAEANERKAKRASRIAFGLLFLAMFGGGIAVWQYLQTNKAKVETQKALTNLQTQEAKNKKLINAFYFYEDKLALAYGGTSYKKKFGFINKEGDVVIDYQYDKAEQFDYTGFAKVVKEGGNYLIDTIGRKYTVAYKVENLEPSTKALDLRGQKIKNFLSNILKYTQLEVLLLENNLSVLPESLGNLGNLTFLLKFR